MTISSVLVANRGEIALRIMRTARDLGLHCVAVYTDADADAPHVAFADRAVRIGTGPAQDSYLSADAILHAAGQSGADAIHPGYGFLSENADFARAVQQAGLIFIGPSPEVIALMGNKAAAKREMIAAGVPCVPGYEGADQSDAVLAREAARIGYPVMIKAAAGGGGRGMRLVDDAGGFADALALARSEAASAFGSDEMILEKAVTDARHVEVQVFADRHGAVVHLFERDCSVQRRHQKIIEEAPCPVLSQPLRDAMGAAAVRAAAGIGYVGAGTVEFLLDGDSFYFLEMNTRLQVEHPVTELITGVDLVEQMIRVANGEPLSITQADVKLNGWAIENRLYAEDPYRGFLPSIGRLTRYRPPAEVADEAHVVRNDTGVYEGGEISMYYDPMIAKLCTWAPTRAEAIERMRVALDSFEVEGIGHNLPFLAAVMDHPKFVSGDMTTAFIAEEYPDGFEGVQLPEPHLRRIAAACAAMHRVAEVRRARISGRMSNHGRKVGRDWVVSLQGQSWPVDVVADPTGSTVRFQDDTDLRVTSDWTPGDQLATLEVGGAPLVLKVGKISGGFRIRSRGADLKVHVRTPRQAELAALMPEKLPPDTSRMLLCPMPGLIVKVNVAAGDEVQEGQALCTVEAMKMENILRAERKGVVSKINAGPGDSLAVDDVIMEFE